MIDVVSEKELVEGFSRPIVTGWKLWGRSIKTLILHCLPIAFLTSVLNGVILSFADPGDPQQSVQASLVLGLLTVVMFVFGIALTQVVLSQQYTRLVQGDAYVWTFQRLVPWTTTWILMMSGVLLGFLFLIVPGIILALRWFWADEFALVHRAGPLRALSESWRLTRNEVRPMFFFQFLVGIAAWPVWIIAGIVLTGSEMAIGVLGSGLVVGVISLTVVYLVMLLAYAAIHGPEIVYLYGMRATRARSTAEATTSLDIK